MRYVAIIASVFCLFSTDLQSHAAERTLDSLSNRFSAGMPLFNQVLVEKFPRDREALLQEVLSALNSGSEVADVGELIDKSYAKLFSKYQSYVSYIPDAMVSDVLAAQTSVMEHLLANYGGYVCTKYAVSGTKGLDRRYWDASVKSGLDRQNAAVMSGISEAIRKPADAREANDHDYELLVVNWTAAGESLSFFEQLANIKGDEPDLCPKFIKLVKVIDAVPYDSRNRLKRTFTSLK